MSKLMRFGRKIALPSTRQIRHELLVLMQDETRRKALERADGDAVAAVIAPVPATPG